MFIYKRYKIDHDVRTSDVHTRATSLNRLPHYLIVLCGHNSSELIVSLSLPSSRALGLAIARLPFSGDPRVERLF